MEAIVNGDENIEGGWEETHTQSPTNATTAPDRLNTIQWVLGQMSTQDNAPRISWFDAEDLQIQQLKGMHPAYGLHTRNIASLRRFLHQVSQQRDTIPITQPSRTAINAVIEANDDLTQALANVYNPPPPVDGLPHPPIVDPYDHFIRWIDDIGLRVLKFVHEKCNTALALIKDFRELQAQIMELTPKLTRMRCGIITKSEVHREIQPCVIKLGIISNQIKEYLHMECPVTEVNGIPAQALMAGIIGTMHITQEITIEQLELAKSTSTLPWIFAVNMTFDKPLLLPWFREESITLDNLSHECTSYNPSPEEQSAQRARNLREAVMEINNQIRDLRLGEGVASENKYESLIKKLDSIESLAFELRAGGIRWTPETYGISEDEFQNLKDYCSDNLNFKKKARKTQEEQEKSVVTALNRHLALPQAEDIKDQESWLSFYNTFNKIEAKIPTSEQKLAYVSERIKKAEDKANVRAFHTFEEVWQYLIKKYHSPINIVPLVREKLSKLETPRDDTEMERNLYKFQNLVATLKSINKLETLEVFFIRSLVKKNLFTQNVQFIFWERLYQMEQRFKREVYAALGGEASGMNFSDVEVDDSYDPQRRLFLLEFCSERLDVLRSSKTYSEGDKHKAGKGKQSGNYLLDSVEKEKCPLCKSGRHKIKNSNKTASMAACKSFMEMSPKGRSDYCGKNKICKVCLLVKDGKHQKDQSGFCSVTKFYCNLCPRNSSSTTYKTHSKLLHWDTTVTTHKTDHQKKGGGGSGKGGGKGGKKSGKGPGKDSGKESEKEKNPTSGKETGNSGDNSKKETDTQLELELDKEVSPEPPQDLTGFNVITKDGSFLKATMEFLNCSTSTLQTGTSDCRFYFQCAFNVQVRTPYKQTNCICLSDTGSTLSFATEKDMANINVPAQGQWKGTLRTLAGLTDITCPFFHIQLVLTNGQTRDIVALGTTHIGSKEKIPKNILDEICNSLGITPSELDLSHGNISILLGLDDADLLSTTITHLNGQPWSPSPKFPQILLHKTPLSDKLILIGAGFGSRQGGSTRIFWTQSHKMEVINSTFIFGAEPSKAVKQAILRTDHYSNIIVSNHMDRIYISRETSAFTDIRMKQLTEGPQLSHITANFKQCEEIGKLHQYQPLQWSNFKFTQQGIGRTIPFILISFTILHSLKKFLGTRMTFPTIAENLNLRGFCNFPSWDGSISLNTNTQTMQGINPPQGKQKQIISAETEWETLINAYDDIKSHKKTKVNKQSPPATTESIRLGNYLKSNSALFICVGLLLQAQPVLSSGFTGKTPQELNTILEQEINNPILGQIICPDCALRQKSCSNCKYLQSPISLQQQEELFLIRNNIWTISEAGRKRVICKFVLDCNPAIVFHPDKSNKNIAYNWTMKLYNKLVKNNYIMQFHSEMQKSLQENHF